MTKLYSLSELNEMRKETMHAVCNLAHNATIDKPLTAAEIASKCEGLASKYTIAKFGIYNGAYRGKTNIAKTRHFIEVDDNGNQIGLMDLTTRYRVNTYKF